MKKREIKFRQFNNGKFHYWGYVSDGTFISPLAQAEAHDLESQQYTGLKDRFGKEIYEGDIVAFDESVMSDFGEDKPNYIEKRSDKGFIYLDGTRGERKYGREIKIVEWKEKSCGFEPFSDSEDNCGHCGGGDTPKGCEVIGNIYENPNLIK